MCGQGWHGKVQQRTDDGILMLDAITSRGSERVCKCFCCQRWWWKWGSHWQIVVQLLWNRFSNIFAGDLPEEDLEVWTAVWLAHGWICHWMQVSSKYSVIFGIGIFTIIQMQRCRIQMAMTVKDMMIRNTGRWMGIEVDIQLCNSYRDQWCLYYSRKLQLVLLWPGWPYGNRMVYGSLTKEILPESISRRKTGRYVYRVESDWWKMVLFQPGTGGRTRAANAGKDNYPGWIYCEWKRANGLNDIPILQVPKEEYDNTDIKEPVRLSFNAVKSSGTPYYMKSALLYDSITSFLINCSGPQHSIATTETAKSGSLGLIKLAALFLLQVRTLDRPIPTPWCEVGNIPVLRSQNSPDQWFWQSEGGCRL